MGFNSIFKKEIDGSIILTAETIFTVIAFALILGVLFSFIYIFTNKNKGFKETFPTTLVVLPIVVSIILMLVGNNMASAFALAGVFTLVRFRSEPGDPKDITYIFATVAVGLACGMGFVWYAALASGVIGAVLLVMYYTKFGEASKNEMRLRILIPEDINYENLFDDVFLKFNIKFFLDKVRTAEFGTVYELLYRVIIPKEADTKMLVDDLRIKNGNLPITLTIRENYATRSV